MKITTAEQAKALEGRTFEKDGRTRTVLLVANCREVRGLPLQGEVYWGRDGRRSRIPFQLPAFLLWLEGAVEVKLQEST